MNIKQTFAIIFTSGLLLSGCTSDETIQVETLREVTATLNGFNQDESITTRTAYNISETSGFQTVWTAGDVLGIYPIGGDQVSFPISDGVGTTTAKFDGGSWALRGTYKYAAYYPFSKDCYTIDQTAIPVSLLGQVQTGSNTTAHLAAYDFMAAAGTQPSSNGSVDLQFNHVGCFLRMQFTMPKAGTYTSVNIETDGGSFTTEGTVNLAAATPALTATATSNKLTLGLNNVTTTAANQTIILYMMVAPDNLSTHTLTFTVEDNAGNTYSQTTAGKNMIATYAYDYSLTLESKVEQYQKHNGHEYVDLGITDGQGNKIMWATCNLGADKEYDYGGYYSWGETKAYGETDMSNTQNYSTSNSYVKTYYDWSTYKWCNGSSYTMTKYCTSSDLGIVDNKTTLDLEDDAAHQNWGGNWQMPTNEIMYSLCNDCVWTWIPESPDNGFGGHAGYKISNKEKSSSYIFLPAAGYCGRSGPEHIGDCGDYWSCSLSSKSHDARELYFKSASHQPYYSIRYFGFPIRPICKIPE